MRDYTDFSDGVKRAIANYKGAPRRVTKVNKFRPTGNFMARATQDLSFSKMKGKANRRSKPRIKSETQLLSRFSDNGIVTKGRTQNCDRHTIHYTKKRS